MKALIGRDTDGWGTRGFVARLEDGQTVAAANATELVQHLRIAGVDTIAVMGSDEGDRALSAALQQALMFAWRQETPHNP